jgi:hypothetical protein
MKVTPNLFPLNSTPPRQINEASEARRAFEAMLSASAARTRESQASPIPQESNLALAVLKTASVVTNEPDTAQTPLTRPGRVIDIKV